MSRFITLLVFLFIISNISFAQKVKPDTSHIYLEEEDDQFDPFDSDTSNVKYIPEDMIFVPSALLYNHQWDNKYIRLKKVDIAGIKDTTLILFNNSPETNFYFPIKGKLLSPFGYRGHHFHTGLDIRLKHNDSVYAVMAGKVRVARRYRGYGNVVVLRHYNGLETVYAHLNKISVNDNDELNAGDLLGLGGRTGHATADHLHFEIRFLEQPINPLVFMDFDNFKLKKDTLVLTSTTFSSLAKAPNKASSRKSRYKGKKTKTTTIKKTNKGDSSAVKTKVIAKKQTATNKTTNTSTKSKKTHTVQAGDNLYNLSIKYNTSVNKLRQLNGYGKKKVLKLGTKIKIP